MAFKRLIEDIDGFLERDPAARSRLEVVLLYPGFHALVFHRLAHALWRRGWRFLGRWLSQLAKFLTGIEIHPGAVIGRRLVIDHGSGVVIGETSVIGDDVTIYQAVTLGGISPSVDSASQIDQKRHPTIGDRVIIGSGAQVLGPIVVGEGARIGANAVVSKEIPPGTTAVGIPARVVMPRDREQAKVFAAYGTPVDGVPDPVVRTIEGLRGQVTALMKQVEALEERLARMDSQGAAQDTEKPGDDDDKNIVCCGEN